MKSQVAAKAVKVMNPDINVIAHQNRVGFETEGKPFVCDVLNLKTFDKIFRFLIKQFVPKYVPISCKRGKNC